METLHTDGPFTTASHLHGLGQVEFFVANGAVPIVHIRISIGEKEDHKQRVDGETLIRAPHHTSSDADATVVVLHMLEVHFQALVADLQSTLLGLWSGSSRGTRGRTLKAMEGRTVELPGLR